MSDVKHWTIERSPFEVYNEDHGPLTHELCDGYTMIAALYVDHDSREAKLLASAPVMEDEITRLQADNEALRSRVTGLVEALESAYHLIANHSGEVLPVGYASDQMDMIDAAIAARAGGDQ